MTIDDTWLTGLAEEGYDIDTWIENLSEEGYDLDRWSDEELVETFITESDLWGSRDAVLEDTLIRSRRTRRGR